MIECSICSGRLTLLGTLGSLAHFRCEDCGMAQHMDASVLEDEDLDDPEQDEWVISGTGHPEYDID